jgi:hypothetical protein
VEPVRHTRHNRQIAIFQYATIYQYWLVQMVGFHRWLSFFICWTTLIDVMCLVRMLTNRTMCVCLVWLVDSRVGGWVSEWGMHCSPLWSTCRMLILNEALQKSLGSNLSQSDDDSYFSRKDNLHFVYWWYSFLPDDEYVWQYFYRKKERERSIGICV